MVLFKHPAVRIVAAPTLLGTFALVRPSHAAAAQPPTAHEILAQAASAEATAAPAPQESTGTAPAAVDARVEARIKAMHKKLHITAAQDTQWDAVAQVMRDNARAIGELRAQTADKTKSLTAIDHLNSFAALTDAQAAGIHKFIPAFQALYDTMSPEQKKLADAMFRSRAHAAAARHHNA